MTTEQARTSFQDRVQPWMMACFGPEIAGDRKERNHRFFEEAGELVQALGMTESEALQLVRYTWSRPAGEPFQEVGGVRVTLAALCLANDLSEDEAAEAELARIWTKVEQIRAKQAAKPKHSPLPAALSLPRMDEVREGLRELMLQQPITGHRETYSDGFAQGLCHAIGQIDAAARQSSADEAFNAGIEAAAKVAERQAEEHRRAASNCEGDGHSNGAAWRHYQSAANLVAKAIRALARKGDGG